MSKTAKKVILNIVGYSSLMITALFWGAGLAVAEAAIDECEE